MRIPRSPNPPMRSELAVIGHPRQSINKKAGSTTDSKSPISNAFCAKLMKMERRVDLRRDSCCYGAIAFIFLITHLA